MKRISITITAIVLAIVAVSIMKTTRDSTDKKQQDATTKFVQNKKSRPEVPVEMLALDPGKVQYWGTGFVVDPSGYVLTCAHVIRDANEIYASVLSKTYEAQVVACDETNDLALLKIPAVGLPALCLSDNTKREEGQILAVVGFPFATNNRGAYICEDIYLRTPRMVATKLLSAEKTGTKYLSFDSPLNPGFTGSPTVNEHGAVIAIVNGVRSGPGIKNGAGLDISLALGLLRNNGVSFATQESPVVLKPEELQQHAGPATVAISIKPKEPLPWPQAWTPNVPKLVKKFDLLHVNHIAVSPDGTLFAVSQGVVSRKNKILIVDITTGETKHTFSSIPAGASDLKFSPNNDMLASSVYNGPTFLWSLPSGTLWNKLPNAESISFSPDGASIACRLSEPPFSLRRRDDPPPPAVKIFNVKDGSLKTTIIPSQSNLHGLIGWAGYLPDKNELLTVGHYTNMQTQKKELFHLWNPDSGELIKSFNPSQAPEFVFGSKANARVAVSQDGRKFAVRKARELGHDDVYVYDLETFDFLYKIPSYGSGIMSFSPDSRILAVNTTERLGLYSVGLCDASTGTVLWRLRGSTHAFCFSPDGLSFFEHIGFMQSVYMYDLSGLTISN